MLQKITAKYINQSKILLVKRYLVIKITNTQQAFTCPKSATETLEQGTNHATAKAYIYICVYIYIYMYIYISANYRITAVVTESFVGAILSFKFPLTLILW